MGKSVSDNKRYRECMAEIVGILHKYDMAGAVTVVSKERAMFKYHFPTWSCLILGENSIRFRAKRAEYPSLKAQEEAVTLSTHVILQMRDIAAQTFGMMEQIEKKLSEHFEIEHKPYADFDPERSQ